MANKLLPFAVFEISSAPPFGNLIMLALRFEVSLAFSSFFSSSLTMCIVHSRDPPDPKDLKAK